MWFGRFEPVGSGQTGRMFAAVVALVVSQAVLAVLLFGTAAMDRSMIDGVLERHPFLPRGWRQRRALRAYRRRLDRLGIAVERAARFGS